MQIVVSGLPGVGKTTTARELARSLGAVYVRIDSIEQALRNGGVIVEGEGYALILIACDPFSRRSGVIGSPMDSLPYPQRRNDGCATVHASVRS